MLFEIKRPSQHKSSNSHACTKVDQTFEVVDGWTDTLAKT